MHGACIVIFVPVHRRLISVALTSTSVSFHFIIIIIIINTIEETAQKPRLSPNSLVATISDAAANPII